MENKFGKKLYSIIEIFSITYYALFSVSRFRYVKSSGLLSSQFVERIMLAVTEVNGCEVCSYAHTKAALESGMTNEEIQKMLSGVIDDLPEEEASAIIFAQHYADSRGKPSKEALKQVRSVYGPSKTEGIAAVIRIIMMGNAYGIVWSSFINRFKGKSDKRSSIFYELSVIISTIIILPLATILAAFANISRAPFIKV